VIVDDHPLVRKGLSRLIEDEADMMVCGECDTAAGALAIVGAGRPDVAIVDLSLGGGSGLELVRTLTARHPGVQVLILSMHDESLFAGRALRAGASGYVMKGAAIRDLLTAVRRVAGGRIYVSRGWAERSPAGAASRPGVDLSEPPFDRLSDPERQVLELIGRGVFPRDMARCMSVPVKIIATHQAHIREKLGLKSARALARLAIGWTQSP
jgi:DNA-binding NarL/FixJ family response regulator